MSYRILRQLGKRAARQVKSLKNQDGVATKDEDEIGEVWTQHLVNVLGGHKAPSVTSCHAKPKRTVEEYSFWPTLAGSKTLKTRSTPRKRWAQMKSEPTYGELAVRPWRGTSCDFCRK